MFQPPVERPFATSDLKFLFHSRAYDAASQALLDAIRRRDGIVLLTGRTGVGKTMLCRAMVEQLDRRTLTSFVIERFETAEELLKTVLVDLGVISRDDVAAGHLALATRADLTATLRSFLLSLVKLQAFAVVIIDDAQDLPGGVLDQVRALLDAEGDEQLMQVILVGQPSLATTIGRPELKSLARRVSLHHTLDPLEAAEIGDYVAHRLTAAAPDLRVEFAQSAVERLAHYSGGLPRIVNLLSDRAMSVAYGLSANVIDGRLIESAADDLDITPEVARSSPARIAGLVAVLLLLMAAGAAVALFVFRAEIAALLAAP